MTDTCTYGIRLPRELLDLFRQQADSEYGIAAPDLIRLMMRAAVERRLTIDLRETNDNEPN